MRRTEWGDRGQHRRGRGRRVLALAVMAGLLATGVEAQTPIVDVEKHADRRIAVGVGRYESLSGDEIGSPAGEVVAFDLEISGWFEPKRPTMLPPRSLEDWVRLGAEVVVELESASGSLHGGVRDAGTGDILFERDYPSGRGETMRARIHQFCDDVVLALTGEPGLARTRVLCEWDPGDGKRVVLMDVDGFGLRELTGEGPLEMSPRWSADAKRAVYTSYSSGFPDVYLHDLVVRSRRTIANFEGLNSDGDLSPDGSQVVMVLSYAGNPEIYSKDLTTGKILRLTGHPGTDASPTWSPDGRRIAFVSDRSGSPQVYVMDAGGEAEPERVTLRGSYNTAPDWAPDGVRIAYCALKSDGFQILVVDLESRKVTTVTELGGCEDPCWSPDGRSILFSRKAGGRTDLYVTNLNERRALRITRGSGRYSTPDWSPVP